MRRAPSTLVHLWRANRDVGVWRWFPGLNAGVRLLIWFLSLLDHGSPLRTAGYGEAEGHDRLIEIRPLAVIRALRKSMPAEVLSPNSKPREDGRIKGGSSPVRHLGARIAFVVMFIRSNLPPPNGVLCGARTGTGQRPVTKATHPPRCAHFASSELAKWTGTWRGRAARPGPPF